MKTLHVTGRDEWRFKMEPVFVYKGIPGPHSPWERE